MGLCSILAMASFLEDIIYEPIRTGALSWPIAFESLLIYLRMIESNPSVYSIADVVSKAGGIDSVRAQAKISAQAHFPAFFRTLGGNPSGPGPTDTSKKAEAFSGSVKGFDKDAKRGCTAWNLDKPHLAVHVGANGICKFLHKCDQYVSDKGKGGQCLGNHKRKDCDYDPDKRVSKPVA